VGPPRKDEPAARDRLAHLYESNAGVVFGYLRRRTDQATAEDLLTEVFLVAWSRIGHVPQHEAGWLCGVARNLLANHNRANRRREQHEMRNFHLEVPLASTQMPDTSIDPDLMRALQQLSPHDREILTLIAWDGLNNTEAAAALGCRLATFNVRLHRARRRFARHLAATEKDRTIVVPQRRMQEANGE